MIAMHGKSPGAGLPAARPSERTHTISQWPEGQLSGSRFLFLTAYNIVAAASLHLTLKNTYFIAARDHLAAARDHLAAARDPLAAARDHLAAARDHLAAARDHLAVARDHLAAARDHLAAATWGKANKSYSGQATEK